MVKVAVKWNKEKLEVDLDITAGLDALKAQLFSLSNVPVERQKILIKGKVLKEDKDLEKVTEKTKLMLMGSADAPPEAPKEKVVFMEDLTVEEKVALTGALAQAGLTNLGNTCYMNSTLQCLRSVKELKEGLKRYSESASGNGTLGHEVTQSLGQLYKIMDASHKPVTPFVFTNAFRSAFPQFAEKDPKSGGFMQQDADEALQQLLTTLAGQIRDNSGNIIDNVFGGAFEVTDTCDEDESEPPKHTSESFLKLKCHIDINTNYLHDGLLKGMEEKLEKRSASLGRNAVYTRKKTISKLPKYVILQYVRFFWRKEIQGKAKIVRSVQFPEVLDIVPYCNETLKKKLSAKREAKVEEQNRELGLEPSLKKERKADAASSSSAAAPMDTEEPAEKKDEVDFSDLNHMGKYEIQAVVTHQGRSANSGHYIGWVREKGDDWVKFDDDVTSDATTEDVKKLCGGGDWHMAYITIYRLRDDAEEAAAEEARLKAKKSKVGGH